MVAVPLSTRHEGALHAEVAALDERPVVLVEVAEERRKGALTPADGETFTLAATLALAERIPLVALIASSGADVHEGVAALHGWGSAAPRPSRAAPAPCRFCSR